MILIKKKLQSQLLESFSAHQVQENYLLVKTSDRDISVNYQALTILSPFFRGLFASAPCCTTPTLILPEFSSASIELFISLVSDGTTNKAVRSAEEAAEVIKIAKVFDIDASDYSVIVANEKKQVKKQHAKEITEPTVNQIDLDKIIPNVSLDESISNYSDFDASFVDPQNPEDLTCQICFAGHSKLSQLLTHYVLAHYMKELYSEFRSLATNKTCNLCAKECKTNQQLFVHIGVKHKKINSLLVKHGYKEHTKKVRSGQITKDDLVNSPVLADSPIDDFPIKDESNSKEKNWSNVASCCQICDKNIEGLSSLWQHYSNSHFQKDIKQSFGHLMDFEEIRCKVCAKQMKQKQGLLVHVGTVHLKVNDVLVKYGLKPLDVKESKLEKSINLDISQDIYI